ncbi:hypothetical protein ACFW04_004618 [Cataglyphis niger]
MSYLGSIGYIMAGSGLNDVLSIIFVPKFVDKILWGHAYSRAVRAHTLVQVGLSQIILKEITFDEKKKKFELYLENLHEKSFEDPTTQLWMQYFEMITIAKEFIRAERIGKDMENLKDSMDNTAFQKFMNNDFFSVKRSDKYFCGIWSDMIIEQTLMKSSKSREDFARGRSTSESVLNKWRRKFCGFSFHSGEQHVDARKSRTKRDVEDVHKLLDWFNSHNPFPIVKKIMLIATGVTGNEKINCHDACKIETARMEQKIGNNFNDIKFRRADRVLPLLIVSTIDPLLLFQRISVMKKTNEKLRTYLEYELAPYPVSLFDETGFLLHRVVWHQDETYDAICQKYIHYTMEQLRRSTKSSSVDIYFEEMVATVSQDNLLSNNKNKSRLISMLTEKFETNNFIVKHAQDDADVLIIVT